MLIIEDNITFLQFIKVHLCRNKNQIFMICNELVNVFLFSNFGII